MEGRGEGRHPGEEASGGGVTELSQGNKQMLVGQERGLGGQVWDPLEAAGSLMDGRGGGQDGMLEGLRGLGVQWAGRVGIRIVP